MTTITVHRLDLQFDADQITQGPAAAQVDQAPNSFKPRVAARTVRGWANVRSPRRD